MLDQNTKRKIDNTRQILVGKIPDPKAQVEQITIALIYKFMDDMDKESEELGGKARFFSNGFSQFSWSKLLDQKLSGQERLELYVQAISSLSKNQNIPQLFRDIFKGAFLPYNDPRTLSMFLKEINEFSYEHSEDLGDSFEYLLSVLGSQGDAGQFRTPRHIIDFIVEAVDPKKNEKILDPACGTAGFLISAFKHILKQNEKKPLTPDEKQKLMNNLAGYDISPDMVKLALVNMYLHGFPEPKIYEYDTLSDERRWDEYADVILANPPFMSPKGGIQPHKRFSIQSNRSEVLFVDYIAEHLSQNGRAGIIVPEGIIFQSAGAYKQLRKYLIENNYLWAVVSLPAGVFNPYSGVKTSILLLDKTIAKTTNNILFVKIENDGLDLGAQRREIEKNDLPIALHLLKQYKESFAINSVFESNNINVFLVEKNKIATNIDFNLSIDRYRININTQQSNFEMVKLGEIIKLSSGKGLTQENLKDGRFPVYGGNGIHGFHDEYFIEKPTIVIGRVGAYCGAVHLTDPKSWVTDNGLYVVNYLREVNQIYLFYVLRKLNLNQYSKVGGQPSISQNTVYELSVPLPPIPIQRQIVSKLEGWQKIIDGAKQVVENYKPEIEINENWELVMMENVCEVNPKSISPEEVSINGNFIYLDISSVENGTGNYSLANIVDVSEAPSRARRQIIDDDVLLSTVRPNLKAFALLNNVPQNAIASTGFAVLRSKKKIIPKFIYELLFTDLLQNQMISKMGKGSYPSINQTDVENLQIPLPSILEQQEIVKQIELEQQIINSNKKLIDLYEQKIKDEIDKLWKHD